MAVNDLDNSQEKAIQKLPEDLVDLAPYRKRHERKPGTARTAVEIEHDRHGAVKLSLMGWTYDDIADLYGVSPDTIRSDIRKARQRWIDTQIDDIGEHQQNQLAQVDHLMKEAWDAWYDSRRPQITTKTRVVAGERREDIEVKEQAGDPRYMDIIKWCVNERSKLLGLHQATTNVNVSLTWEVYAAQLLQTGEITYDELASDFGREHARKVRELAAGGSGGLLSSEAGEVAGVAEFLAD